MRPIACPLLLCLVLGGHIEAQRASTAAQEVRITKLVDSLHTQRWLGAEIIAMPLIWSFNFTDAMKGLLEIGSAAQAPLLAKLSDLAITDQVIIVLGGVGDERSVGPIIKAMKRASSSELPADRRKKTLTAGNIALTNITVADVIWHRGGGIIVDRCPDDPTGCWSSWWQRNEATFRVRGITQSRRYSNYPNYGIYLGMP
jgi:hypothetical protein